MAAEVRNRENARTVGSIERATSVLALFAESKRPTLGVTEIATELGLSKAVVHRMLASLRDADLIKLDPTSRRYSLGPATLKLGLAYLSALDIREIARPALARLSGATHETATLSIRHQWQRVYIDQVTPAREVKMTVVVGQPFPLHAGASSKAFLAFLSEEEQREYLDRHDLSRLTDETITDRGLLQRELEVIRKRGFARSLGERQAGAASVAAPVFDHQSAPAAVMSVCGPFERFRTNVDAAAKHLLEETRALSRELGFR